MKKDLLHTPEGVRDIYGSECRKKKLIIKKIERISELYGYSEIETPTFEFFDVFNSERGTIPSNEMFKFVDSHGSTLVLKPDMTPAVARVTAKYFNNNVLPIKLSYTTNTFINHDNAYRGQLKENTIAGAELIGNGSCDEDFEIICMAIDCIKSVGIKDFQIEIGNVSFFHGLMKEAGIDKKEEDDLVALINKKNYLAVNEIVKKLSINNNISNALAQLPTLFGSVEVLEKARMLSDNNDCVSAVDRLLCIYEKLKMIGYEDYVSFDLGSLSSHTYYTGIIFNAYTFDVGDEILSGGRYNKLIKQFGSDRPSVGFSANVEKIMDAINRQNIKVDDETGGILIVYDKDMENAEKQAFELRNQGKRVSVIKAEGALERSCYEQYASDRRFNEICFLD